MKNLVQGFAPRICTGFFDPAHSHRRMRGANPLPLAQLTSALAHYTKGNSFLINAFLQLYLVVVIYRIWANAEAPDLPFLKHFYSMLPFSRS